MIFLQIEELIRANIFYIITGYSIGFVALLIFFASKNRGKILVRIKSSLKESDLWMKPDWQNSEIVMIPGKDKNTGWTVKFSTKSLFYKTGYFGLKRYFAIEVFPFSSKAIEYDYETETTNQPHWDKKTEERLFEAKVIKAAGETMTKIRIPLSIYVLIMVNIGITAIVLLVASGRLKIG